MKKNTYFGIVILLAFSLALPIYSMADMKLNLLTHDGYPLTSTLPVIRSFFVDTNNTLNIILKDPLVFLNINPQIGVSGAINCAVSDPWDGSISAQAPTGDSTKDVYFTVSTPTQGAVMSPDFIVTNPTGGKSIVPYGATFATSGITGTFHWKIQADDVGTYLAAFHACIGTSCDLDPDPKSEIVVMIKIVPAETVTPPTAISPLTGTVNQPINFTASGATVSTPGHTVEYRFNWGDESAISSYSSSPQPHTYTSNTSFPIKAQARCAQDQVESTWFSTTVTISNVQTFTLTVNINPSSAAGGVSLNPSGGLYTAGTQVTLTASANSNYNFSSWSGVDSSNGATAYVTMPSIAKAVTATFTPVTQPGTCTQYLDSIAPKSGNRYGLDDVTFSAGSVRTYCLPMSRLFPGNHTRLVIDAVSLGVVAGGDIALKLTSPGGKVFLKNSPTTSNESLNITAGISIPDPYITGTWALEITAKVSSRVRIWWYLPY